MSYHQCGPIECADIVNGVTGPQFATFVYKMFKQELTVVRVCQSKETSGRFQSIWLCVVSLHKNLFQSLYHDVVPRCGITSPECTNRFLMLIMDQRSRRIPREYPGSPGETKDPNRSPNSETDPGTDLNHQGADHVFLVSFFFSKRQQPCCNVVLFAANGQVLPMVLCCVVETLV